MEDLTQNQTQTHTTDVNSSAAQISIKLDGSNYALWSQVVEMYISGKDMLGYINGELPQPLPTDPCFPKWRTENAIVKGWLINSMDKSLILNFIRFPTAKMVWNSIASTYFDASNSSQVYDLKRQVTKVKQAGGSIEKYYNDLQRLWIEIDFCRPNPMVCSIDIQKYNSIIQEDRVYVFLDGLDDRLDKIRSDVLQLQPFPTVEQAYAHVRREDIRQASKITGGADNSSGVVMASKSKAPSEEGGGCTHCGKLKHTREICFKAKKQREATTSGGPGRAALIESQNTEKIHNEQVLGSSSSAAISMSSPPKYDVFLSFRGEDTRDNFISHLYAELRMKKIETFIDYKLGRGDEISPALYKAIEESMIYVVILSKNYTSSTWCLDELTKILKCRERYGRDVIPVFYKVDPSDVRHQRQSYAEAFVKHQQRFKDDQMDEWKAALTQVASLSGWDSQVTRPEHTLIEDIAKDVLRKLNLNHSFVSNDQGMIGIDKHIEQIQSLLHNDSQEVRIVGIWGMGGIGKTTIARAIYHKLATQFRSSSIILNVQQEIKRCGLQHIRSKYRSELLGENNTSSRFSFSYERPIKWTEALLVLDDVNNSDQLKDLIGSRSSFGYGSTIIVTSRDMLVLKNIDADGIYEVKEMDYYASLRLFCLNAFKQSHPISDYVGLTEKILNYAKGVPLTLKVLGSLLCGKTKKAWESQLQKLDKLPENDIFKVLKLSYKGLDEEQKDIFLDIACFYRGHLENVVAQTLDSCGFSAHIGMDILKDRCLISISERRVVMHDLIQEMGHEIVRQECVNDPGKRSRLWKPEEIYQVFNKNKGTDAIQCIFLEMCMIEKVQLHAETFRKMDNLRMMVFYKPHDCSKGSNVTLPAFFNSLPDDLEFLHWDDFPLKSLPLDFCPKNLVKLYMPHSHLEQLWQTDKELPNLKTLDLRCSRNLIQIPDLAHCPNIEEVILSHCPKLGEVYSSSFLCKLKCLWLNGCVSLRRLHIPSSILQRPSGLIVLHGCHNLEMFSASLAKNVFRNIVPVAKHSGKQFKSFFWKCSHDEEEKKKNCYNSVVTFDSLDYAELNKEPNDNIQLLNLALLREGSPTLFPSLNDLCWLDLSNCESLSSLPIDLFKMTFLRRLYLSRCFNLEKFPEIEATMESLEVLMLNETAIKELPSSLHRLVNLEELSLYNCQLLETIPSSIGSLSKLNKLNLTCCESLETFPSSIFKLKLRKLDLHGCLMLKTFPEILERAETFVHINLTKTAIKELPSSLEYLVGLQTLCLKLCSDLVSLPNSIVNLNYLSELDCSGCHSLTEIPNNIGSLSSLRELSLQESNIVSLPESIALLSSLKSLDLSDCKKLECIPQLPPSLNQLLAYDCPSIGRMMPNSRLELPSISNKDTFKFHFTNSQQLDETACSNIGAEAWLRITGDAYRSVFLCFTWSSVPRWFPYRCTGRLVTMKKDSQDWPANNRLVGFALSVVLGCVEDSLTYRLTYESDGRTHILPNHDKIKNYYYWKGRSRFVVQDHTFIWKYHLDFGRIDNSFFDAHNFTFELRKSRVVVKECGICPLYTKEKDDNCGNSLRLLNNDIEEPSALAWEEEKKM